MSFTSAPGNYDFNFIFFILGGACVRVVCGEVSGMSAELVSFLFI